MAGFNALSMSALMPSFWQKASALHNGAPVAQNPVQQPVMQQNPMQNQPMEKMPLYGGLFEALQQQYQQPEQSYGGLYGGFFDAIRQQQKPPMNVMSQPTQYNAMNPMSRFQYGGYPNIGSALMRGFSGSVRF